MNTETLDKLEALHKQSAPQRIDRARLFKNDPANIALVSNYQGEVVAIRTAKKELTSDMQRAYRLNENMDDGEIRKWLDEFRTLSQLPEKIEAGIERFDGLQDSDFDEWPYPENAEYWQIVSRRMANKLGADCFVGAASMRMRQLYSLTMSKLKDIDRKATAQGVNPFRKKRRAEVLPSTNSEQEA